MVIVHHKIPLSDFDNTRFGVIFGEIYRENGILTLGAWVDENDPLTTYSVVGYRDREHYRQFVEKMKTNELYQETTRQYEKYRDSVKSISLSMLDAWLVNIDESMVQNYLHDVKVMLQDYQIKSEGNY